LAVIFTPLATSFNSRVLNRPNCGYVKPYHRLTAIERRFWLFVKLIRSRFPLFRWFDEFRGFQATQTIA
jgi:hypothetical protein